LKEEKEATEKAAAEKAAKEAKEAAEKAAKEKELKKEKKHVDIRGALDSLKGTIGSFKK
jgi:membrane protein involved in colicin uptake